MNKSIVIRAASKYRQWMTKEASRPYNYLPILNRIDTMIEKFVEMQSWTIRLKDGTAQRIRRYTHSYKSKREHSSFLEGNIGEGIICAGVYKNIATHMIPDIGEDIKETLTHILCLMKSSVDKGAHTVTPLPLRDICDEIRVINEAWPKTEYLDGVLSVLISDVCLEDDVQSVDLGHFRIRLRLSGPLEGLTIESLSQIGPSSGGYRHPHVSDGNLCSGEGGLAMKDALCQGRLEDYFRIVEAVLRTYNSDSPYESLVEWYDPTHEGQFYCEHCDEWREEEELYDCGSCDSQACEDCIEGGGCCVDCGCWKCDSCCTYCQVCEETICDDCKKKCEECGEGTCEKCVVSCAVCSNAYCSGCKSDKCTNCGDGMCGDCEIACSCCRSEYCSDCINEHCVVCNSAFCEECNIKCEDCGNPMCQSCADEHTCLLAGVNDAKRTS